MLACALAEKSTAAIKAGEPSAPMAIIMAARPSRRICMTFPQLANKTRCRRDPNVLSGTPNLATLARNVPIDANVGIFTLNVLAA
jgi:hypothetical protein